MEILARSGQEAVGDGTQTFVNAFPSLSHSFLISSACSINRSRVWMALRKAFFTLSSANEEPGADMILRCPSRVMYCSFASSAKLLILPAAVLIGVGSVVCGRAVEGLHTQSHN